MERFVLQTTASEIEDTFHVVTKSKTIIEPTFNAAPGHILPTIFNVKGAKKITSCIWDSKNSTVEISEFLQSDSAMTVLNKQACILPISGFYVWKKTVNDPHPFYVRIHTRNLLGIPGFFSEPDESRNKFTLFTRSANVLLKPLDEIMPCILEPEEFEDWLNHNAYTIAEKGFRSNNMIPDMTVFRVPKLVNDRSNNSSELIQPIPKLREDD